MVNGGAVGEDGTWVGRESRRRVFGNELAGIPSQGWIRPSVAPKSFHAYVWSGCWMSSAQYHPVPIYPEGTANEGDISDGIHILTELIADPPPVSPVDFE